MATIQGLTAPRMLEIEAAAIVAGVVDENMNLILTKHDGSTINAGKVQGDGVPTGGTEGQIIIHTVDGSIWADNFATNVEQVIKNSTGATLSKGTAVYVSGASGDNVLVSKAQANAEATSSKTLGLLHNDVANGATGQVITEGTLYGFNTSAATVGDPVWLSPTTAGGLVYGLANKPTVPNHMVYLGVVIRSHAVNGAIYVKVQNGYELDELHDVKITNPQPKQVIKRDPTNQFWLNEAASGGVVVSGTTPVDPSVGDGWFYDANGDLFVRYFDGTNYAWMQPSVPMSPTIEQRIFSQNYCVNGGFDIWQRGLSGTIGGTVGFAADRWQSVTYAGGTMYWFQQPAGTNPAGTRYCARIQRASGATNAATTNLAHSFETIDVIKMAGKTLTLSYYARCGANYSPVGSLFNHAVTWGTDIDKSVFTGGITGGSDIFRSSVALTSSWQRYTVTFTVPSNATSLGISLYSGTNVGTAGAADYWDITGVQLEEGSTATPFRRNGNSVQAELTACQRYYCRYPGGNGASLNGAGNTASMILMSYQFPVEMRAIPSISYSGDLVVSDQIYTDPYASSCTISGAQGVNRRGGRAAFNGFSGVTVARWFSTPGSSVAGGYLEANAEI